MIGMTETTPEAFVFYLVALLVIFTLLAALAERWDAKARRDARDQARAAARAKRREERETFVS